MLPPGTLVSFGLVLVRVSAFVLAVPLLGTGAAFSGYKVALIGGLSLLAFFTMEPALEHSVGTFEFAATREDARPDQARRASGSWPPSVGDQRPRTRGRPAGRRARSRLARSAAVYSGDPSPRSLPSARCCSCRRRCCFGV